MIGSKATTGIGNASVTHHTIIKPPIASTFVAAGDTLKGLTKYRKSETAIPERRASQRNCCLDKQLNLVQDIKKVIVVILVKLVISVIRLISFNEFSKINKDHSVEDTLT